MLHRGMLGKKVGRSAHSVIPPTGWPPLPRSLKRPSRLKRLWNPPGSRALPSKRYWFPSAKSGSSERDCCQSQSYRGPTQQTLLPAGFDSRRGWNCTLPQLECMEWPAIQSCSRWLCDLSIMELTQVKARNLPDEAGDRGQEREQDNNECCGEKGAGVRFGKHDVIVLWNRKLKARGQLRRILHDVEPHNWTKINREQTNMASLIAAQLSSPFSWVRQENGWSVGVTLQTPE
jgi:hypothetical protein